MLLERILHINPLYVLLYFIVGILTFCSYKYKRKEPLYVSILVLILFSGFRHNAGIDYVSYVNKIFYKGYIGNNDYLSLWFMSLARQVGKPYIFFTISAMCYVLGITYGLKRLKLLNGLSVFLLTTFTLCYLSSFGFVRQFSAIGVGFLAWVLFYERKYLLAIPLMITAYFLHFSAVIWLVPLLFFSLFKKEFLFWDYIFLIIGAYFFIEPTILLVQKIPSLSRYADRMLNLKFGVFGQKIFIGLMIVFCISSIVQEYFVKNKPKLLNYVQNIVVLGLVIYSLFLTYGEHFSRISYYFIPFFIIWNTLLYKLIDEKKYKKIFLACILVVSTIFYFATLYFSQGGINGDFLNKYEFSIGKY